MFVHSSQPGQQSAELGVHPHYTDLHMLIVVVTSIIVHDLNLQKMRYRERISRTPHHAVEHTPHCAPLPLAKRSDRSSGASTDLSTRHYTNKLVYRADDHEVINLENSESVER